MTFSMQNTIFFGDIPRLECDRILEFLQDNKFDRAVVPCAGRYSIVEAIARAGIKPDNIICGGTSLFTTILGYYLSGQDPASLNINSECDFIDTSADPGDLAAQILFAMRVTKIVKLGNNSYYAHQLRKAMHIEQDKIIGDFKRNLQKLYDDIHGIKYILAAPQDIIPNYVNDEKTIIFIDTPAPHTTKRAHMFNYRGKIEWSQPQTPPEVTIDQLIEQMTDIKATAMVLDYDQDYTYPGNFWNTYHISADAKINKKILKLNKPLQKSHITRPKIAGTWGLDLPIISKDDKITEDSTVKVIHVWRDVAWYYRDLFTHRFGAGATDNNYIILIDGKIVSVRGYGSIAQPGEGVPKETYGIVYNNTKYRHLSRLLLRLITSYEYGNAINDSVFPITAIKTTTHTYHKEDRMMKGLGFTLYNTEDEYTEYGRFKLQYILEMTQETYKDKIKQWLQEEANYDSTRTKKRKPRSRNRPGK